MFAGDIVYIVNTFIYKFQSFRIQFQTFTVMAQFTDCFGYLDRGIIKEITNSREPVVITYKIF